MHVYHEGEDHLEDTDRRFDVFLGFQELNDLVQSQKSTKFQHSEDLYPLIVIWFAPLALCTLSTRK